MHIDEPEVREVMLSIHQQKSVARVIGDGESSGVGVDGYNLGTGSDTTIAIKHRELICGRWPICWDNLRRRRPYDPQKRSRSRKKAHTTASLPQFHLPVRQPDAGQHRRSIGIVRSEISQGYGMPGVNRV